jgi:hypothetical protein
MSYSWKDEETIGDCETTSTFTSLPRSLPSDHVYAGNTKSRRYKYIDYAKTEDEIDEESPVTASLVEARRNPSESSIRLQKFPVKLYFILTHAEFHDVIGWMPHGRSWKVIQPAIFESMVMPLFFEYSNYHSFNRLVNAWSFRRISSGPDRGSYYHKVRLFPRKRETYISLCIIV